MIDVSSTLFESTAQPISDSNKEIRIDAEARCQRGMVVGNKIIVMSSSKLILSIHFNIPCNTTVQ
jgi:hypothetical protein